MKLYFRDLPEPLFTSHLYPSFMEATNPALSDEARRRFFAGAFCAMPKPNYETAMV